MKSIQKLILIFSAAFIFISSSWALDTGVKPLAEYMTENRPIDLRNATSQFTLTIPVSKRAPVQQAHLHLRATNSISLLGARSQLVILVNNQVAAQIPLNPKQPEIVADIDLPASALRVGYNKLTFSVAQHYTETCEDPSAPELWVQVDSVKSTLSLTAPLREWQPRLSELADVFDPKLNGMKKINILTVGNNTLKDTDLAWGGLVSQGVALRLEYAPLEVRHLFAMTGESNATGLFGHLDQRSLIGFDNILLGTRKQLAPFLPASILDQINDGFMGIYHLDADPKHFILIISGTTDKQVRTAAEAFALLNFPYPDSQYSRVSRVELPVAADYAAHNTVYPNEHYQFKDLGFQTHTVQGMFAEAMELNLNIPPALFAKSEDKVELHLRFAYGASLRKDSVLNVFLNDHFENVIPLKNDDGGYFRDYTVSIPLNSFKPGANTLRFSPRLMPLITGECQSIQTGNLSLTLFDNSRLDMPNAAYYVSMPDLSLFAQSGFPYTVKSGGANVTYFVPSADSDSAAAAWMLMGKLSQDTRMPMFNAQISSAPKTQSGEWVVVSPLKSIPVSILKNAPMTIGEITRAPYPIVGGQKRAPSDLDWSQRVFELFRDLFVLKKETNLGQVAYITATGAGLGRNAMAMQYQAPWNNNRTITLFSAVDSHTLVENVTDLIQPQKWSQLAGDYAIWRNEPDYIFTQRAGGEYLYGEVGLSSRMEYYFNRHPFFWAGTILLVVIGLALLTLRLLMRHKRRYHSKVNEIADVKD
ncbi:MAG: cellulose biosynthesis cyclic di-GMP-binding regulatory protein BcsB [Sulfuriferula sp.]